MNGTLVGSNIFKSNHIEKLDILSIMLNKIKTYKDISVKISFSKTHIPTEQQSYAIIE